MFRNSGFAIAAFMLMGVFLLAIAAAEEFAAAAEDDGLSQQGIGARRRNGHVCLGLELIDRGFQAADEIGERGGGGEAGSGGDGDGEGGEAFLCGWLEEPEGEARVGDVVLGGDGGEALGACGDFGQQGVGEALAVGEWGSG